MKNEALLFIIADMEEIRRNLLKDELIEKSERNLWSARKWALRILFSCLLLFLSVNFSYAVTISEVPTAVTFGMPIGGNLSGDLSLLSIGSYSNGYPKIRFNDDIDNSSDVNEWYVGTAHNRNQWITAIWAGDGALGWYCVSGTCSSTNYAYHPGEDWNATNDSGAWPNGDRRAPIYAIANGVVIFNSGECRTDGVDTGECNNSSYKGGYGNTVIILHRTRSGEYITSFYAHMAFASQFQKGEFVRQGSVIGYIGDTGPSDGYHLHFEIRKQTNETLTIQNGTITLRKVTYWPNDQNIIDTNFYEPSTFLKNYTYTAILGDWNGNGEDTTGTFKNNVFTINGKSVGFGIPGDIPIIGDWDMDGKDEIGVYRPDEGGQSYFYLITRDWDSLSGNAGAADKNITFGTYPQDIPIAGDWDGDSDDDIGGFDPNDNMFYLYTININVTPPTATPYGTPFQFGESGDYPIVGDWDSDGDDDVGVFRVGSSTNEFYFDIGLTGGQAEYSLSDYGLSGYGNAGDIPIIGDWDSDGDDNIGVYRPSTEEFFTNNNVPNISANPVPDIKANGSDGPITIEKSNTLSVNVSLIAGSGMGIDCDWWVVVATPFGWYYFDVGTMNWIYAGSSYTDLSYTHQGPLFNLSPFEVLNISGLPEGTYTFYFAIDTNMNGSLDSDQLYYDAVSVNIIEGPPANTPPTAAITIPSDGSTYTSVDSIIFSGTGYDTEDGALSGSSLVWKSNVDGQIGTGTSFTNSSLSVGTHTITLTVTDSGGLTGSDSVNIIVESTTSSGTIQLPKTGQTTCYDELGNVIPCAGTGQDGDIQAGVAWPSPRFTDNADATITDNLTGLMWTQDANLQGYWYSALNYVAEMNEGVYPNFGYTDWRLPNVNELKSLINAEEQDVAEWLNGQGFIDVQSEVYWSSTTDVRNTGSAQSVYMRHGNIVKANKFSTFLVWPVRDDNGGSLSNSNIWKTGQKTSYHTGDDGDLRMGVEWPEPRFYDKGDGTVTDNLTGLIWTQDANLPMTSMSWQDALDYVIGMNEGTYPNFGYTDWRLPNKKEFFSLIDHSKLRPALPEGYPFVNVQSYYWSSTTNARYTFDGWLVLMEDGYVGFYWKDYNVCYVWPVRAGGIEPAGNPDISVLPTSYDYGSANVGSSSVSQTFTGLGGRPIDNLKKVSN